MLNSFDFTIAIIIAICYNMLAHCCTSALYEGYDYVVKYNYSVATLMILGILALVLSRLISTRVGTYVDSIFSMSMCIAGILLILTTILIDWHNLNEITQVIIMGIIITAISYYIYTFC